MTIENSDARTDSGTSIAEASESPTVPDDVSEMADSTEETPEPMVAPEDVPEDIAEATESADSVKDAPSLPDVPEDVPETSDKSSSPEAANMPDRFRESLDIEAFRKEAIDKFRQTDDGQKFLKAVSGEQGLQALLTSREGDVLTRTSSVCDQAGICPSSVGTLVHRVAELRTLDRHSDEVVDGTRRSEQRIEFENSQGEKHCVEIDDVIVRGDKHYIRDYKPVNLSKFEQTKPGQHWSEWMTQNVGEEFRDRIRQGANPYDVGESQVQMPVDIRAGLRDYLDGATQKHKDQLDQYKALYAQANHLEDWTHVHTSIRPYWVFR